MKQYNVLTKKKAFTLIELLVVISIIGLLTLVAVVALKNARQKARDSRRAGDIEQIRNALDLYATGNNSIYPNLKDEGAVPAMAGILSAVPQAPIPPDGSCIAANNGYLYNSANSNGTSCASVCSNYELQFCLGAITGNLNAGIHCATPLEIKNGACNFDD